MGEKERRREGAREKREARLRVKRCEDRERGEWGWRLWVVCH